MQSKYAPIALFTYNRLDNLKKTIACLRRNSLSKETPIYVFSDGGRDEKSWLDVNKVRCWIKQNTQFFKSVTLIERSENFYLERNITEGISQVLSLDERIIVLEDDVLVSPYFLNYINDALEYYKDDKKVMHVSGFTNLDVPQKGDVYFTRHMAGWGWATWKDRWMNHFIHFKTKSEALSQMTPQKISLIEYGGNFPCLKSLEKNPIPWDICWEIAIYKTDGLCLSPSQTLVRNCGINQGTHFKSMRLFGHYEYDRDFISRRLDVRKSPVEADQEVEEVLNPKALKDYGFRYNLLGKLARYIYKKFKR